MPRPRCEPIEILDALGEQEPVELWRRGDRCSQIDAPLLRRLVVQPIGERAAEDTRTSFARLLRPPQRLQPIAIRRAFAPRVRAPLAAVPLVELVHAFGVAKVATFADFLAADPG